MGSETKEVVQVVLHETVMVVTEIHTDVKVVVVVWTREVLVTTSNQNSVEEWVVLEEDVVAHQQVEDLELLHQPAQEVLVHHHQVRTLIDLGAVDHLGKYRLVP